jgi:two-component system, chemotaxis family, chemotaxis protein CheY
VRAASSSHMDPRGYCGTPPEASTPSGAPRRSGLDRTIAVTLPSAAVLTRRVRDPYVPALEAPGVVEEPAIVAEILVVDDSKVMRDMIVACLRPRADLAFTQASSGLEAIERLSLKAFHLVVLDLNMPDIGGIEVLEFVRGQDKLKALPIIIVTTRGDDVSRSRALEAGASRFMTKPFTPDAILQEVDGLLGEAGAEP